LENGYRVRCSARLRDDTTFDTSDTARIATEGRQRHDDAARSHPYVGYRTADTLFWVVWVALRSTLN